jgi:hypothetical protein
MTKSDFRFIADVLVRAQARVYEHSAPEEQEQMFRFFETTKETFSIYLALAYPRFNKKKFEDYIAANLPVELKRI